MAENTTTESWSNAEWASLENIALNTDHIKLNFEEHLRKIEEAAPIRGRAYHKEVILPFEQIYWPQSLIDLTLEFSCKFCTIDQLSKIFNCDRDNDSLRVTEDEATEIMKSITGGITSKSFVKMSSRSPKDYLSGSWNSDVPVPINGVESDREIVEAFRGSIRTLEDFISYYWWLGRDAVTHIVVRPFVDIDPRNEFRALYRDGELLGVTQYRYMDVFDYTDTELESIKAGIYDLLSKFESNVIPELTDEQKNCTLDIVKVGDEWKIVELNILGLSDPCLYDDFDFSIPFKVNLPTDEEVEE